MPFYDYFCAQNGETIEVSHSMSQELGTWGEVCEMAEIEPGDTPSDAPVRKLPSGGSALNMHNSFSFRPHPRAKDSAGVVPMRDNKW